MVGLSASQLQAETLFPGDTIEYYSMAFVAGDPRGHRVSKVLRVDRKDDEFPIRVDTQEMLPLTIMLKRKQDRNNVDISSDDAKWRKLRTFKLVNGEVEGETRADRLNAGLKKSLSDAMRSTKKQLAKEKEEKANASSQKVMNGFFTKLDRATDEGETTSSQRSSLERISTPERKKKKRKPLTPRENTDDYSSGRSHDKIVSKRSHSSEKMSRKNRPEDETPRPKQKFKYDKPESRKRKRNDSTLPKTKRIVETPGATKNTISKYFGAAQTPRRSKNRLNLSKFLNHAEEKDGIKMDEIKKIEKLEMKKKGADINEYMALDKKQQEVVETVEARMKTASRGGGIRAAPTNAPNRSDNSEKKAWNQQRSKFRETSKAPGALHAWLTPLERRKNELEEISGGTPTKPQQLKQRTLNLAPDKPKSPKMDRKSLSFVMFNSSGDAAHRKKEVKHYSKHLDSPGPKKQVGQPRKKLGSLGTERARAPKPNLTGQWNHRKTPR